jgi:hypothetical protein
LLAITVDANKLEKLPTPIAIVPTERKFVDTFDNVICCAVIDKVEIPVMFAFVPTILLTLSDEVIRELVIKESLAKSVVETEEIKAWFAVIKTDVNDDKFMVLVVKLKVDNVDINALFALRVFTVKLLMLKKPVDTIFVLIVVKTPVFAVIAF